MNSYKGSNYNYNENSVKSNSNQAYKFKNEDSVNIKKRKIDNDADVCYPLKVNAPKFSNKKQDIFDCNSKFGSGKETDAHRIEFRLKQVQYGKNTVGYDNYVSNVPKEKRKTYSEHPRTPDVYEEVSKRAFDGKIKAWRKSLHRWDVLDAITTGDKGNIITTHSGNINNNSNNNNLKKIKFNDTTNNTATILKDRDQTQEENINLPSSQYHNNIITTNATVIGEDVEAIDGYDYNCETDLNNEELYFIDSKAYTNTTNSTTTNNNMVDNDEDDDIL